MKLIKRLLAEKGKLAISISILEILIGLYFLISGIYLYVTLLSIEEADKMFGGVVDFFMYKESTYSQIFLSSIILFSGISIYIKENLFWILNQIVLIAFLSIGLTACFYISSDKSLFTILFIIIVLSIFVLIERKLNDKRYLLRIGITNKLRIVSWVMSLISSTIYLLLTI